MRSLVLLVSIASCTEAEPPSGEPPPTWVYAPAQPDWQLGPLRGRFGRGQAPQQVKSLGITGDAKVPLRDAVPWAVPGEPTRAIVSGLEGPQVAIELVEVDSGKHVWRHSTACVEPVIGVTARTIVCGGATGVRGVGLDGKPGWKTDEPLVAITGARIVVGKERDVAVLGADDGKELARVALPAGVDRIVASCEQELLGYTGDQLQRIAEVKGKQAITWSVPFTRLEPPISPPPVAPRRLPVRRPGVPVPVPAPAPRVSTLEVEAIECGESIVVATRPIETPQLVPTPRPRTLRAIARASGKLTGTIEHVRGWWPAREGQQLEVSAAGLVTRWPRDLAAPGDGLALPILGELLDASGDRRLVRATPSTAVVLDRTGAIAYVPLATSHAVLGKTAIVAATLPSGGLRRIAIPPKPERVVRVPPRRAGVALPAELRDLPAVAEITGTPIAKPEAGKTAVTAIAIDPREPAAVYAAALEVPGAASPIARADLATGAWTWQRSDGCAAGAPIGLVLADDIVACATQGPEATVRVTARDGTARWDRALERVDAIDAAGGAVLAYHADRLTVLDAATGDLLGRIVSPDGARVRAVAVTTPIAEQPATHQTWLVTYERGRLIARIPAVSLVAVWSLAVDGVVASLAASGDGVLVSLDDGDAYRVELATASITPMPGLGLRWRAAGELVTGETVGGVIPGIPVGPAPVRVPLRPGQVDPTGRNPEAPELWIPIPAPPPLGDSWQYTLYERSGAPRARNDYGLAAPVAVSPARGPAGSPIVVVSGLARRDILVLDPKTGNPLRRVVLPGQGFVFGTIVDGSPVAGAVLAAPLRIIVF